MNFMDFLAVFFFLKTNHVWPVSRSGQEIQYRGTQRATQKRSSSVFTVAVEAELVTACSVVPLSIWDGQNALSVVVWLSLVPVFEGAVASVRPSQFTFEQADPEEGLGIFSVSANQLPHGLVFSRAARAGQVCAVQPAVGLSVAPDLHLSQHGEHAAGAICKRHERKVRLLCGGRGKVRKVRRSHSGRESEDSTLKIFAKLQELIAWVKMEPSFFRQNILLGLGYSELLNA